MTVNITAYRQRKDSYMYQFIKKLFKKNTRVEVTRQEAERRELSANVREQFQKLKDKGLSIPVFTL